MNWWNLAELLGIWSAAFATFYAARTALRIAQKQDEIRLKIRVVDGRIVDAGKTEDIVWIRIVNVARRSATVTALGWKFSWFTKNELYQKVDHPNPPLPLKLSDGDEISISIPVQAAGRGDWYSLIAEQFASFGRIRRGFELSQFRFQVICSTGEVLKVKPDYGFMTRLREACKLLDCTDEQRDLKK